MGRKISTTLWSSIMWLAVLPNVSFYYCMCEYFQTVGYAMCVSNDILYAVSYLLWFPEEPKCLLLLKGIPQNFCLRPPNSTIATKPPQTNCCTERMQVELLFTNSPCKLKPAQKFRDRHLQSAHRSVMKQTVVDAGQGLSSSLSQIESSVRVEQRKRRTDRFCFSSQLFVRQQL